LSESISAKLLMGRALAWFDSRRLHQPSLAFIRARASAGKPTFGDDHAKVVPQIQRAHIFAREGCPPELRSSEGGHHANFRQRSSLSSRFSSRLHYFSTLRAGRSADLVSNGTKAASDDLSFRKRYSANMPASSNERRRASEQRQQDRRARLTAIQATHDDLRATIEQNAEQISIAVKPGSRFSWCGSRRFSGKLTN